MKLRHLNDAMRWLIATLAALVLFRLWPGLGGGLVEAAVSGGRPPPLA